MLKKSLFIGTFFLLFIGLSDYGYGCHRDDGNGPIPHRDKPCKDDGGGGNGGGDGLTLNLTGGTFVLDDPLPVNLNKKGTGITSASGIIPGLTRQDDNMLLAEDWDAVFEACRETLRSLEIPEIDIENPMQIRFGDGDWQIAANAGFIRLRLFDARLDVNAVIGLELFGDAFGYVGNPIPPDEDVNAGISQFVLDRWEIFGGTERGVQPRDSCHLLGGMYPSTLTICGENVAVEDCHPPSVD